MIKFLLLLMLPLWLFGSKVLSYNIYDRTDRADVMITFDTPYDGVIKQSVSNSKIIIKLEGSTIESSKLKQLSSKFLHSLSITPIAGSTQIVASVPKSVKLQASKTSDAYGLRLRFTDSIVKESKTNSSQATNSLAHLPTKQSDDMTQSYVIVVTILIIGIIMLFVIKKKVTPVNQVKKQDSWLFKENKQVEPTINGQNSVSIRFQKSINEQNSVVMLDFADQSYLVMMGNSNILLDKFVENKPSSQEDFETILQNRHKELDDFLSVKNEQKEPLQSYKEKASSISYEA